jgi:5-methyltetrahydropteroyltriglutamate--homocysteine methyltransferase
MSGTETGTARTAEELVTTPLLTHEVGSLMKPNWRVKANAGRAIGERDVEDARVWGERLGVAGYEQVVDLLRAAQSSPLTKDQKDELKRWSSRYGLALEEKAGLDVVYDGEQQRFEMYAGAVGFASGFEWRGSVRSFDNKYYSKAAVAGPISLREPYHSEEFTFLRSIATAALKVPITGAYTIADWSFDEVYLTDTSLGGASKERHAARKAARRQMILDVARTLIRPNLESLIGEGAQWLQVDEPAGSTGPDELDLFVESFNESVRGLEGAVFTTHLCFSDYDLFFPAIEGMTECRQFAVGFANDDTRELGTTDEARPGYHVIRRFRDLPYSPALGLGVLDIHTDFVEPPELVRDRVLYAVEVFDDPTRVHVMPDCGLRTRSWDVALAKLTNMVEGTAMAKDVLGL